MSTSTLHQVTGADVGYSGEDQIRICLRKIVDLGGVARMQDLYTAMEEVLNPQGYTLSDQGKSSLRFFINSKAVERGYVYPHDKQNPGWRITPEGEHRLGLQGPDDNNKDEDDGDEAEAENLLVRIDRVLGVLEDIDPKCLPPSDGTTLVIEGPPRKIQDTVRSMIGYAKPGEIVLRLTLNRQGWYVALDVHPRE